MGGELGFVLSKFTHSSVAKGIPTVNEETAIKVFPVLICICALYDERIPWIKINMTIVQFLFFLAFSMDLWSCAFSQPCNATVDCQVTSIAWFLFLHSSTLELGDSCLVCLPLFL